MWIYCKSRGLFIQVGTWKMTRPRCPNDFDRGLVEAGNEVYGIRDFKTEKAIVLCVMNERYDLVYHLLNNFHEDKAWIWFNAEANGLKKI